MLVVVGTVAMLAAGCKVETSVLVDMHENGSGVVTVRAALDAGAVQAAEIGGGKLENRVRLGDLGAAGWTVSPWRRAGDGSASLELSKRFDRPEQVPGIARELSGKDGPLRDVTATRDRTLFSTDYRVSGALDLAAIKTGLTTDPDLVAKLSGQTVDVNALDQSLLESIRQSFSMRVTVKLPGGGEHTLVGRPGKRVPLVESSTLVDGRRVALVGLAVILVALALVLLLGGRRRRRARGRMAGAE